MSAPLRAAGHIIGLAAVVFLGVFLLYASRFWIWAAPWSNDGLFGLRLFSPFGDIVTAWLRGTALSPFNIVIWGAGAIILLSLLHWLASRLSR